MAYNLNDCHENGLAQNWMKDATVLVMAVNSITPWEGVLQDNGSAGKAHRTLVCGLSLGKTTEVFMPQDITHARRPILLSKFEMNVLCGGISLVVGTAEQRRLARSGMGILEVKL